MQVRGGNTRCIACHRAWDAEGIELSEEEAEKLIPKARAARPKSATAKPKPKSTKAKAKAKARAAKGA